MDHVNDSQELSFSPPNHSFSPPTPFIRNGIRYNEFREILNTAVQATQHDRPMQRQPEVLGKKYIFYMYSKYITFPERFQHINEILVDAEDIFADADSIDAVPRRPGVGFMSAIQISDDEMDAVCKTEFNSLANHSLTEMKLFLAAIESSTAICRW